MLTHYFISAHLLLAAGYLLYKLLGHDTFFTCRRLILLGITLFALTAEPLAPQLATSAWPAPIQLPLTATAPLHTSHAENRLDAIGIGTILWTAYWCIAVLLLLRLTIRLCRLGQTIRQSAPRRRNGLAYRVLEGKEDGAFSFFQYILVGKRQESSPQLPYILLHEQAHAKGLHSLDIVWMQLLYAIFWINPFVPLIARELRTVHEYLADRTVRSATTDAKGYQLALLHQIYSPAAALLNNFNVSSLKRRIAMLNQKPTPRKRSAKFLVLLPVALTAMLCFSWAKASIPASSTAMPTGPAELNGNTQAMQPFTEKSTPADDTAMPTGQAEQNDSRQAKQLFAEKRAEYPGGLATLMQDLSKIIRFPPKAIEDKADGKCTVSFTINTDGSVSNPRVFKSLTPECDKEALRAVTLLKKFKPATTNGKPVTENWAIPITFRSK